MGNSNAKKVDLYDLAFEMQFEAKQLDKQARKIEAQMKKDEKEVLSLMNSGYNEAAQIKAEGIIRMKGESLNIRRLGAQMSAVSQKLKMAERTKDISKKLKHSVPIIQKGLKQMDNLGINKAMAEFDNYYVYDSGSYFISTSRQSFYYSI